MAKLKERVSRDCEEEENGNGREYILEWDYLFVNGVTINTPGDKEQIDSWSIFYWNGQIEVVFYSS